jgi:hypothetical protein
MTVAKTAAQQKAAAQAKAAAKPKIAPNNDNGFHLDDR